jgi:U3 small nucleolar RNA-associated protein 4
MVRIFQYDTTLEYSRAYPSTNSRVLSICHHPSQARIFLGCADGTIRCHDTQTGRGILRMRGEQKNQQKCLILSLVVTSHSLLVSGDNFGNVQIWNGELGVLSMTFHQHTAEILALALSSDESKIFASGVDSRVICIQKLSSEEDQEGQWIYSSAHRSHSHDVYALAIKSRKTASDGVSSSDLLLSGGLDGKICQYSVNQFAVTRPSWILPVSGRKIVSSSTDGSLVAVCQRRQVDIWAVNCAGKQPSTVKTCNLACQLQLKDEDHVSCFAMSPSAKYLALSSASGTKIWQIMRSGDADVELERITLPSAIRGHALAFCFASSANLVAISLSTGDIAIAKLDTIPARKNCEVSLVHQFRRSTSEERIVQLSLSNDGLFLAGADAQGNLSIYNLDV